ncbi:MAG TPA: T9SS type A sorting domain-containing protein [Flavobacteriaceae bacterium]|nr:T9SS type A sorting domain-containing protein [Flavobacteriaceae bacterium]
MKKITLSAVCFAISAVMFGQEMLNNNTTSNNPIVLDGVMEECSQAVPSNGIENGLFFGGDTNQRLAVDIMVDDNVAFAVETLAVNLTDDGTFVNVIVYDDNGSMPGTVVATVNGAAVVDVLPVGTEYGFDWVTNVIDLSTEGIVLEGEAKYWIEIESDATAWEATTASILGDALAFLNDNVEGWTLSADENGSTELVFSVTGDCTPLSTNDYLLSQVAVYPNPANDVINISLPASVEVVSATLFDILGKNTGVSLNNDAINISTLARGVYMLNIETNQGSITKKIMKR